MPLSFDAIAAAEAERPDFIDVPVPKWGGDVRISRIDAVRGVGLGMRFNELPKADDGNATNEAMVEFYVLVVSACAVDADGALMFADDARRAVLRKDMTVINILGPAACKLNGFGTDLEKN